MAAAGFTAKITSEIALNPPLERGDFRCREAWDLPAPASAGAVPVDAPVKRRAGRPPFPSRRFPGIIVTELNKKFEEFSAHIRHEAGGTMSQHDTRSGRLFPGPGAGQRRLAPGVGSRGRPASPSPSSAPWWGNSSSSWPGPPGRNISWSWAPPPGIPASFWAGPAPGFRAGWFPWNWTRPWPNGPGATSPGPGSPRWWRSGWGRP